MASPSNGLCNVSSGLLRQIRYCSNWPPYLVLPVTPKVWRASVLRANMCTEGWFSMYGEHFASLDVWESSYSFLQFCRKKPKASGHNFCSRSCAIQAKQQQAYAIMSVPYTDPTSTVSPTNRAKPTRSKSLPSRILGARMFPSHRLFRRDTKLQDHQVNSRLRNRSQSALLACGGKSK